MNVLNPLCLLLIIIVNTTCLKILCVFPTPFYSHQSAFQPIWQELSLRKHQVTVITTNPLHNTSLTNLKEIDLSFTYKLVFEDLEMQNIMNTDSNLLVLMKHVFYVMNNMTQEQLKHRDVQNLLQSDQEFDLILAEVHIPAWFGLATRFGCPIIGITSMGATNHLKHLMGNTNSPVLTPSMNLGFVGRLSFIQRLTSVLFEVLDRFQNSYLFYPVQQGVIRRALNDPSVNIFEISRSFSLVFTNVIPGFSEVAPNIPAIVPLSGVHIKAAGALPPDLQSLLDGARAGAVYFSLGSYIKSHLMAPERRKLLLEVFAELKPLQIIWKFEQIIGDLPENVKIVPWVPQQDVLRHKNVKLFITQGGLQSIQEGIRFRVPMLGLPFFGDQYRNAMRIKELKLGDWLEFSDLSKSSLKNTILRAVKNETYRENLKRVDELSSEGLINGLDKAVWWIEYVGRHKGAELLKSPLRDMPFYQYYLFDVIAFIVFFIAAFLVVSFKLVRYLRLITRKRKIKSH